MLAALFAILALLGAACGGGSEAEPAAEMPVSAPTLPSGEVIPTEALPDPLPEPYLFRDTAVIEEQVQSEVIYVVTAGDTLAGIASGFCVTIEEIQRLNNIVDVAAIGVGDELRIPVREGACGGAAPSAGERFERGGRRRSSRRSRSVGRARCMWWSRGTRWRISRRPTGSAGGTLRTTTASRTRRRAICRWVRSW